MFEDMHWNDEVSTWNLYGRVNRIRKIDDYTVQFEMDNPYPVLPVVMVTWPGGEIASYAPKHYLKKWHIKYNEERAGAHQGTVLPGREGRLRVPHLAHQQEPAAWWG